MIARDIRRSVMELFEGPTLSQLATINRQGRPWTRYVMSRIDDEMTLRIPTKNSTRKIEEIGRFPFVHLLVGRNLFGRDGAYAQIEGRAAISQDAETLRRYWTEGLNRYFTGPGDPSYVLIEIRPDRIEYWAMSQAENPYVLEEDDIRSPSVWWEDDYWMSENGVEPVLQTADGR